MRSDVFGVCNACGSNHYVMFPYDMEKTNSHQDSLLNFVCNAFAQAQIAYNADVRNVNTSVSKSNGWIHT